MNNALGFRWGVNGVRVGGAYYSQPPMFIRSGARSNYPVLSYVSTTLGFRSEWCVTGWVY